MEDNQKHPLHRSFLTGLISFQLFTSFAKSDATDRQWEARFILPEDFEASREPSVLFKNGIAMDKAKAKNTAYLLIVRLSGDLWSTDQILFESLRITETDAHLQLIYKITDSRDGDPFPADHFLIFPAQPFFPSPGNLSIGFDLVDARGMDNRNSKVRQAFEPIKIE